MTPDSTLSAEDVRIGETLRALRESRELRVGEFAVKMGVSQPYWSNIEAGRKRLTPKLARRAADLLGVRVIAIIRSDHWDAA